MTTVVTGPAPSQKEYSARSESKTKKIKIKISCSIQSIEWFALFKKIFYTEEIY